MKVEIDFYDNDVNGYHMIFYPETFEDMNTLKDFVDSEKNRKVEDALIIDEKELIHNHLDALSRDEIERQYSGWNLEIIGGNM